MEKKCDIKMPGKKGKLQISLLYCEDEKDIREAAVEILSRRIETVYVAENGSQGLEMFEKHKPDIIVTDIRMPLLDGISMLKQIRKDNGNVKTIVVSAHSDIGFFTDAIELGVSKYIIKPLNTKILFDSIEELEKQINADRIQKEFENEKIKMSETRNKIYSIIGHDLRGPMGSMGKVLDILIEKKNVPNETREKLLKEISDSAHQMYYLLENLMDWAKTGEMKSKIVKINIKELVDKTIVFLNRIVKEKNILIINNITNNDFVEADERMVFTVVRNLLSNALKFTKNEGTIELSCCEKDEYIHIKIKDNGVGISREKINQIFSDGKNKSTLGTNGEKGTGFGLVMCKELIEANEGEIWVESEEGVGSTFTFSLKKAIS